MGYVYHSVDTDRLMERETERWIDRETSRAGNQLDGISGAMQTNTGCLCGVETIKIEQSKSYRYVINYTTFSPYVVSPTSCINKQREKHY